MKHILCSRKEKIRNHFQNANIGFNWKPRMHCQMQLEMTASHMSSTFLDQHQKICRCYCCQFTPGKGPQKASKYLPFWTFQLWKSFLLEHLERFFNSFVNTAQNKYVSTELDEVEVAYITNSHWTKELIAWPELLNLLEDAHCKPSHPENVFVTDLQIPLSYSIPICTTRIRAIECWSSWFER